MKTVQKCFALGIALVLSRACFAQVSPPPPAKQPYFAIAISLPPVVKAESELLLEIAMTNTSGKDIYYGAIAGWPAWRMFQIDLRDADGGWPTLTPIPTPKGGPFKLRLSGAFLRRAHLHFRESPGPLPLPSCTYRIGAAVPSDHLPAGTMNTSIGSGLPLNCGFSMTGEWGRSAPQTAPSMSGV